MAEWIDVRTLGNTATAYALHVRDTQRIWRYFHEAYCVTLVVEGFAEWKYRSSTNEVRTDALMLMEPGEVHVNTRVHTEGTFFAVFFEPTRFNSMVRAWGWREDSHFRLWSVEEPAVRQSMVALYHSSLYEHADAQEEHLNLVAGAMVRSASEGRLRLPPPPKHSVHKGVRLLCECYARDPGRTVSIREIAQECRMGYHWFVHSFRNEMGMAPYQFVKVLRLSQARKLLTHGPCDEHPTIRDVALACGFSDGPHMTREFKSQYALSPRMIASRLNTGWSKRTQADRVWIPK